MTVWIVCNERAGRGLSANDLRALVERAGHTVAGVAKRYDVQSTVPNEPLDLIVAAGGDGTVAAAAGIAEHTSAPLAILPLGTANNVANSLGLQRRIPELIASWPSARRVPFDVGCARAASHEWRFVEGVGGGLVPAGIARTVATQKHRKSDTPSVAVAAAVRVFRETLVDLAPQAWTITIDGRQFSDEFLLVEVLNIRSVGPNLVFAPDASSSDGYFDVVMAQEADRKELEAYFDRRAGGRDMRPALPHYCARRISIASCTDLHIDDERVDACALGPFSIEIERAAITVLV